MKNIYPRALSFFFTRQQLLTLAAWMLMAAIVTVARAATPPAGTSIGNQATATYTDDTAVTRTVTSNTVVTIVQQVASFTLTADGDRRANAGGQVAFPHTLTNTGNGADTFALTETESATSFTFSSVQIYADANGDGVPDNSTNISTTGELAAGASFRFVVVGTVPGSASNGNTNTITVTGRSGFTTSLTRTNADLTTITTQAVINVTKAIDVAYGPSPSAVRTFTLTYTNTGNTTATAVAITDDLKDGFVYEAGTGRWSGTGSLVLTDLNAENQSGIAYDFNTTTHRITATIASVPAGQSGTVTFQVKVASNLQPGPNALAQNTAQFAYNNGAANIAAVSTNMVQYTVAQTAAVTVSSDTVASATQGATFNFTNVVTNTGNGTDTFNLSLLASTFPAGSTIQLFRADGLTPLTDSNGDGIPDTGPLANAAAVNVIVKVTLPQNVAAAPGNGPYAVNLRGTSTVNSSVNGTGTDTLTTISANTVDLTNDAAGSGNPGFGAFSGGAAVVTNTVAPNATTRFTVVVANSSSLPDNFNLTASQLANFSTTTFPAGWTVVFHDAAGNVVTNTGVIAAGANKTIYADVTAPANATTGFELYIRGQSPSSNASDILHDAVAVGTTRSISLTPNNLGQAVSGGTVVYTHKIVNTGTNVEGAGGGGSTVALNTSSSAGFTSVVYWDANNNGVLDSTDPIVTSLANLTGGTNGASTAAGLDPGEQATLFVKVTSPPGAAPGATDTTTLSAVVTGTINGQAAPTGIAVTDTTAIVGSNLSLVKTQALDANCDGTEEGSFVTSALGAGAVPGACIRYRITATNAGSSNITGLLLNDATPANTVYHGSAAAAAVTVGSVTTVPSDGAAGSIQATVGTLTPGQIAVLSFGVRINP